MSYFRTVRARIVRNMRKSRRKSDFLFVEESPRLFYNIKKKRMLKNLSAAEYGGRREGIA